MSVLLEQIRERIKRIGWAQTARRSGVERVQLYRNFSGRIGTGNPRLSMIEAVLPTLGLQLTLTERTEG